MASRDAESLSCGASEYAVWTMQVDKVKDVNMVRLRKWTQARGHHTSLKTEQSFFSWLQQTRKVAVGRSVLSGLL